LWWSGRIEVGDAERAQHRGGPLSATGDATFGAPSMAGQSLQAFI